MAEKKDDPVKDAAAANEQVAKQIGDELDKGYRGHMVDPTPNENYTVAGVTAGKPTPETDAEQAKKARDAAAERVQA